MNIFVLHPNPISAASYHCDQHLHKMILESAQMLSTAMHKRFAQDNVPLGLYKPTHTNHPCTQWIQKYKSNMMWVIDLCTELESIRESQNCAPHASMQIVRMVRDWIEDYAETYAPHTEFVFAGPWHIALRNDLTVPEKYQQYYRYKNRMWEAEGKGPMTWKNRQTPEWFN
jgi:hypothetical protein